MNRKNYRCPTCGQVREANALIALRNSKQWGLAELAAKTGVSANTISRFERGEDVKVTTLVALGEAYGLTVDEVLRLREAV